MTNPAVSTALSPVLQWQQRLDDELGGAREAKKQRDKEMGDMTRVFMALLQDATFGNPTEPGDPTMGMKAIQGLIESHARITQNQSFEQMATSMQQGSVLQAASLVGKVGEFARNQFTLSPEHRNEVAYEVPRGTTLQKLNLKVFDDNGNPLFQMQGATAPGRHTLSERFQQIPHGTYALDIEAFDTNDNPVDIQPLVSAPITHVNIRDGQIFAGLGSDHVPLSRLKGLNAMGSHTLTSALASSAHLEQQLEKAQSTASNFVTRATQTLA